MWHRGFFALAATVSIGSSVIALTTSTPPRVATAPTTSVPRETAGAPTTVLDAPPPPEPSTLTDVYEPEVGEATPVPAPVPPQPWRVVLIGDSIAFTAGLGLAPHASDWGFEIGNEGINGCGVVRGGPYRYFGAVREMDERCEAWPTLWQEALVRQRPHLVAIVVGRWELMDRVHDGQWTNLFDAAFAAYIESEIEAAVVLARSAQARVALFTSPYYRRGTTPEGGLFPEDDPARVDAINTIIRKVAERQHVPVIDVGRWLSPEGRYTSDVAGVRVRSDGVHLTRASGDLLAPLLFPQLHSVMVAPSGAAPSASAPASPS